MGIDKIQGAGFSPPLDSPASASVESASPAQATEMSPAGAAQADSARATSGASGPEAQLGEAIHEAARDYRAGTLSTIEAAFEKVISSVVERRCASLPEGLRGDLATQLTELLSGDPLLGDQIRARIEDAAR